MATLESLVPTLTGYTGPGVTISASSERDSQYPAWKAFDSSIQSAETWGWGANLTSASISVAFDVPVTLHAIRLKTNGNGFTDIKSISVYTDDALITTFASKLAWWTNNGGIMDEEHTLSLPPTGKTIKLGFMANRDGNYIAEIQLLGIKKDEKSLLEIGNRMYTISNGNMLRVNETPDYSIDTFRTHRTSLANITNNMEAIKNTGESFKIHTIK